MKHMMGMAVAGAALLAAAPALAQNSCTRAELEAAVDSYLAAQGAGDPSRLNLAPGAAYIQDREPADLDGGILTTALDIDFHLSIHDTEQCQSFTELVDTTPDAPYIVGAHLTVQDGAISEVSTLVTTTGDWLFNASNFLKWASQEDWSPIPEDRWDSRETLVAAADSYLDLFNDKSVEVPWATPCRRLEGGAYTGTGAPDDSCDVGVPDGVDFPIRDYVIDQSMGSVVVLLPFGGEGGLPDSHLFRVADGRITNVHTITVCAEGQTCPQIPTFCTRDELQAGVDSYLAAQRAGNPALMTLAANVDYKENFEPADIAGGILASPQQVDFHLSLLDEQQCRSFTEIVITEPSPYVLGVHLALDEDRAVREIDTLVTDEDDWLFSAQRFLDGIRDEDWGVQPLRQRHNRQVLRAAADSYLDLFNDPDSDVPWGLPCYRQEGGLRTSSTCDVGVPEGVPIVDRRYVIDPAVGGIVALVVFGNSELPDSHMFRVESGYITNIHTITVCREFHCGFPVPDVLSQPLP